MPAHQCPQHAAIETTVGAAVNTPVLSAESCSEFAAKQRAFRATICAAGYPTDFSTKRAAFTAAKRPADLAAFGAAHGLADSAA